MNDIDPAEAAALRWVGFELAHGPLPARLVNAVAVHLAPAVVELVKASLTDGRRQGTAQALDMVVTVAVQLERLEDAIQRLRDAPP